LSCRFRLHAPLVLPAHHHAPLPTPVPGLQVRAGHAAFTPLRFTVCHYYSSFFSSPSPYTFRCVTVGSHYHYCGSTPVVLPLPHLPHYAPRLLVAHAPAAKEGAPHLRAACTHCTARHAHFCCAHTHVPRTSSETRPHLPISPLLHDAISLTAVRFAHSKPPRGSGSLYCLRVALHGKSGLLPVPDLGLDGPRLAAATHLPSRTQAYSPSKRHVAAHWFVGVCGRILHARGAPHWHFFSLHTYYHTSARSAFHHPAWIVRFGSAAPVTIQFSSPVLPPRVLFSVFQVPHPTALTATYVTTASLRQTTLTPLGSPGSRRALHHALRRTPRLYRRSLFATRRYPPLFRTPYTPHCYTRHGRLFPQFRSFSPVQFRVKHRSAMRDIGPPYSPGSWIHTGYLQLLLYGLAFRTSRRRSFTNRIRLRVSATLRYAAAYSSPPDHQFSTAAPPAFASRKLYRAHAATAPTWQHCSYCPTPAAQLHHMPLRAPHRWFDIRFEAERSCELRELLHLPCAFTHSCGKRA